jgi:3-oxoacyl-(acyl-carrier-protein) synthase
MRQCRCFFPEIQKTNNVIRSVACGIGEHIPRFDLFVRNHEKQLEKFPSQPISRALHDKRISNSRRQHVIIHNTNTFCNDGWESDFIGNSTGKRAVPDFELRVNMSD